jgi:hypothetical protein
MAEWRKSGTAHSVGRWWLAAAAFAVAGFVVLNVGIVYFIGGPYPVAWGLSTAGLLLMGTAPVVGYRAYKRRDHAEPAATADGGPDAGRRR